MATLIKIALFVVLVALTITVGAAIITGLKDIHNARKSKRLQFDEFIDSLKDEE